jgi:hypothetical protein
VANSIVHNFRSLLITLNTNGTTTTNITTTTTTTTTTSSSSGGGGSSSTFTITTYNIAITVVEVDY